MADPAIRALTGATDCEAWSCPPPCTCPTDDGYEATALTIGPWDPGLQHAGPPAALLLREAERASGIDGGQTVRMAYDIFAPVPVGPVRVRTSVVRPGRRIELVETVLSGADDRPLMRLSAWRMRTRDDGVAADRAALPHPAAAGPEESRPEDAALLHRGRRLPPGPGVAVRHRQLQRPRAGVGLDPRRAASWSTGSR